MTHDDWASQRNITIMCRVIPHIMRSFPAITCQTQDTFPHSRNAFLRSCLARILVHLRVSPCIFTFHHASSRSRASSHSHASSCSIVHLHVSLRIFVFHHASSRSIAHLRVPSRIFAFHPASSRSIAHLCVLMHLRVLTHLRVLVHLRVSSRFSAHHRRSIHPLSSQFLGASHSVYYYIWLCLASYDYYFVMDPYITSFTYSERSRFASEPWEGAYVQLRVAMSVFYNLASGSHHLSPVSSMQCMYPLL